MKQYLLLLVTLCIVNLPANAQMAKITYKNYKDAKKGISINYPSTWEIKPVEGTALFIMRPREEQDQKFMENLSLIIDPPDDLSLQEYADVARQKIPASVQKFKEIKSSFIKIGTRDFFRMVYSFNYKGQKMHDIYYVTVVNNCSYTFTCSAIDATFSKFQPVFETMMRSLKIK